MHTLNINRTNYYFAENWDEITAQQFIYLCRNTINTVNINELKLKLLLYFTGLKVFYVKQRIFRGIEHYLIGTSKENAWWISANDLAFASKALDFLFTEIKDSKGNYICYDVSCKLVKNLFPEIELPGMFFTTKLHGPADGITNLKFEEYIFAETKLAEYKESGKAESLHKFIAVLYRPAKKRSDTKAASYDGDIRKPFNPAFVDNDAAKIAKLPAEYKKAILHWYEGCKSFLMRQFPNVFKLSDQVEGHVPGTTFRSYMKLVDSIANSDPTKKPEVRNGYLIDVLESLEQTSIKAQQQQEEFDRIRNR